jgi:hypothetical protein
MTQWVDFRLLKQNMILRLPPSTSGRLSQRGGFDGSQPFGDAREDTAGALSTARSDVGWRRGWAASQPTVGGAVGRKSFGHHDRDGERSATRPTVKRASPAGSAHSERCSTSSMRWDYTIDSANASSRRSLLKTGLCDGGPPPDTLDSLFQGRQVTQTQSSVKAFSQGWIRANE